jgi:hypothetical protein
MNVFTRLSLAVMASAVLVLTVPAVRAGSICCHRCGREGCQKVCRLECDEKELEVTCWDSKCEEFCVSGPCRLGCKHCAPACGECGSARGDGSCETCKACGGTGGFAGSSHGGKKFVWRDTIPGCAKIFTQKKLLKKVEKKKIKTYKWVLEDLCQGCRAKSDSVAVPAGTPVPPVPTAAQRDDVVLLPIPVIGANASLTDTSAATARQTLSDLISR